MTWGVKSNKSDMIILAGLASNVEVIMEPISIIRGDMKGKARVRVVSMVWGTQLTVRTDTGRVLGKALEPIGFSDQDVQPGKYNLEIVGAAGTVLYSMPEVELKANRAYTMLLAGGKDGTQPITIMNVESEQETTRVKIINKGAGAADIYQKELGTLFAKNLASEAATGFISTPSGAVTFVARVPGSAANSQEMAAIATQLLPGRDVTIVINANRTMEISEEVLTPLPDAPTSENHPEALQPQQQVR